jgi:putative transposase
MNFVLESYGLFGELMSSIEDLKYHLVFATKYRYNLITFKIAEALKNYFIKQQNKLNFKIHSLAIESNHVHILLQVNSSTQDLNKTIQKLKGGSSFLIRKNFKYLKRYVSLWTPSHFIASVGNVSKETIQKYINSQGIREKEIVQRTFKYRILNPTKCKLTKLKTYFQECLNKTKNIVPSSIYQDFDFHKIQCKNNEMNLYIRSQNSRIEKQDTKLAKYWIRIPGSRTSGLFWLGMQGRDIPRNAILKDSLIQEKKGVLYLNLVIEQYREIERADSRKLISIDLGLNHPIASVMLKDDHMINHKFYGKRLKNLLWRRERRYSQLQHSGIEKPGVSKYTRSINNLLHEYTNDIINKAKELSYSVCIGNLSGIRKKFVKGKSSKKTRKKGCRTPFGKIMNMLEYKAKLNNIPLVFLGEMYTSQKCSKCGEVNSKSRSGEKYRCISCGYQQQADINGAINIGRNLVYLLSSSHPTLRKSLDFECKPMALAMG